MAMMRATKIVVTLGPATDSEVVMRGFFASGGGVFRLNASHGTQDDHARRIKTVRELAAEYKSNCGILLDLQGPKIRLGTFKDGPYLLREDAEFVITTERVEGNQDIASTGYPEFARDVKPGDAVLLADGAVQLCVLESNGIAARCRVVIGGMINDRKGINLPGAPVSPPSLSKKDVSDSHFGVEQGVDFFAMLFVLQPRDVLRLRHLLEEM